jgi:hypothetical protein
MMKYYIWFVVWVRVPYKIYEWACISGRLTTMCSFPK